MERPLPGPRDDRRVVLDTTRELSPEEMAELQLEQGYLDRALEIYEALLRRDPRNTVYRMRCEWLLRLTKARLRPTSRVGRRARWPSPPCPRERRRPSPVRCAPTVRVGDDRG